MTIETFFEIQKTRIGRVDRTNPEKSAHPMNGRHNENKASTGNAKIRADYERLRLLHD